MEITAKNTSFKNSQMCFFYYLLYIFSTRKPRPIKSSLCNNWSDSILELIDILIAITQAVENQIFQFHELLWIHNIDAICASPYFAPRVSMFCMNRLVQTCLFSYLILGLCKWRILLPIRDVTLCFRSSALLRPLLPLPLAGSRPVCSRLHSVEEDEFEFQNDREKSDSSDG